MLGTLDRIIASFYSTYSFWDQNILPITICLIGGYVIFFILEKAVPVERGHQWKGIIRNLSFGITKYVLGSALLATLAILLPWTPKVFSDESTLIVLFYVVKFLVLQDLFFYAYHRAQHSWSWLWPVHEMHHAERELNVTSSYRIHWLESSLQYTLILYPVFLILGVHIEGIISAGIVATSLLLFSHSNLRIHLGPIGFFVIGPQFHRIHHSILPKHQGKNLCQVFPFIDWIFGTYHHPAPKEYPPTGTHSLASDAPFWSVINRPFVTWFGKQSRN